MAQYPMGVPSGLSWLNDTLHGIDIYSKGFVKNPTLFFDPSNTDSLSLGTLQNPYNTQADLMAAVSGNMSGHVIGFKRGSTLQVSGTNGLSLICHGLPDAPLYLVPYGDAEELPIISAHATPTWTLVTGNIWQTAMLTQHDVWQSEQRMRNVTWNIDAATTLITDGTAAWNSNVMYIRPLGGENPNLGQVFVSACNNALLIRYSDVSISGHITLAGLDFRYARNSVCDIGAEATANITEAGGIVVAGCGFSKAGVDKSPAYGSNNLVIYGPSDAIRLSGVHVVGNKMRDALNNAIELSGTTGSLIEHNRTQDCGGNLVELWSSNDTALIRYNYGHTFSTFSRVNANYNGGGLLFANYYNSAPGVWDTNDSSNSKNTGNIAVFNVFENCSTVCAKADGGSGHVIAQNTWIIDHDALYGAAAGKSNLPAGLMCTGTAATGFLKWSNNILYYKTAALVPTGYLNPTYVNIINGLGASNSVPEGDNNAYYVGKGYGTANWRYGATSRTSFIDGTNPSWKFDLSNSGYTLDANSLASNNGSTYGSPGGTLTDALVGMDCVTFTPLHASLAGATSLSGIGTRYYDGQPYVAAACTIGAMKGS